jgi:hypothetical protein
MKQKKIQMIVSVLMGEVYYEAHQIYVLPQPLAVELVRNKAAKAVVTTAKKTQLRERWYKTLSDGDGFRWQIKVKLSHFNKPYIDTRYEPEEPLRHRRIRRRLLEEVGGDGDQVSPTQANAINYLLAHEATLYSKLLGALASYAGKFRADWENLDPQLADRIVPDKMTTKQVARRIEFRTIYFGRRWRNGIAYIEFYGECTWDREHGFRAVMHRNRVVGVMQQGVGWQDDLSS